MESLPEEIVLNIIGFLDIHSFPSVTLTCKLFQRLCNDQKIMIKLIYNTYPWLKSGFEAELELDHKTYYRKIKRLYKKVQNELSEPIPTTTIYYPPEKGYPDLNCDYFIKDSTPFVFDYGENGLGCFDGILDEDCYCRLEQDGSYTIIIFHNTDQPYGPFNKEEATIFLQEHGYKKADEYSSLTFDDYWFGKEIGLLIDPKPSNYG